MRKSWLVPFLIIFAFVLGVAFSFAHASLTLNSASITGSGSSTIDVGNSTLSLQTTNNGPIAAGTGLFTIPNLAVTSGIVLPLNQSPTSDGGVAVKTTSSTLNFNDNTAERVLDPIRCTDPFVIQNVTSSPSDEPILFARVPLTITEAMAVNESTGDTMTFNVIWGNSRNTASSSAQHLFASNVTSTSITALDTYPTEDAFASTTVPANSIVRLLTASAASSSEFSISLCYRENP